ncbi:MAG: isopentenyl phosphate kinase family protein [Hadesarchaea archaeon]|nr:isopentenyl phosphate kinase family protein [Hadesarchaea archaeon]
MGDGGTEAKNLVLSSRMRGPGGTRPIVVKLGGSVITDKSRKFCVRREVLKRLAEELAATGEPLVVVHGGGSFGHPLASEYGLRSGLRERSQLIGVSLTHRAMEQLNGYVIEALQGAGLPAVAIQPSACAVMERGRIAYMEIRAFKEFLGLGLVPVSYGDVVPDLARGVSILSGDQLVVYLAQKLNAKRVVIGVDVGGVYTGDPKVDKEAKLIREITPEDWEKMEKSIGGARGPDVTGGMANKIRELLELAKCGIEAQVVDATRPGVVKRAILGEPGMGTRIISR